MHFLRTGVPQWGQGFFLPGFRLSRRREGGEREEGEEKEREGEEGEAKRERTTYCNITLFVQAYIICAMQHG